MRCAVCGTELPDEAAFCWRCGSRQQAGPSNHALGPEVCRVRVQTRYEERYGGFLGTVRFGKLIAEVEGGPKGRYVADESKWFDETNYDEYRKELSALVRRLAGAGWEPMPAIRDGSSAFERSA